MATKKKSKRKVAKKKGKKKAVRTERKPKPKPKPKPTEKDRKAAVDKSDTALARKNRAKKALERSRNYAASGLAAQVTETLLDEMRALDKLWHQTPEAQQAVVISRLSDSVYNAMQKAVQVLSAKGHKAVICNLFSVTFKDGVRATITVGPGSDLRHDLADHATKDVVLVLADPGEFMEGLSDLKPDADQPRLI